MLNSAQRDGVMLGDWIVRASGMVGIYRKESICDAMEYAQHSRDTLKDPEDIEFIGPVLDAFVAACKARLDGRY